MDCPGELEESLLWKLPQLGVQRIAVYHRPESPERLELVAWLPRSDWSAANLQELERALSPLGQAFGLTLPPLRWDTVADEDWSLSWKSHWRPDPIGQSLLVLPAWLEVPPDAVTRRVIRLDPGPAFGTGSHPTTRLCLEGLEALGEARVRQGSPAERPLAGLRVADLGCGSGLLGLAALALGAESVVAVDTDPLAITATRANGALNGVASLQVALGSADVLEALLDGQPADLLLCNILAPVIADLSPCFDRLLSPAGQGLLSGLLGTQAESLIATLAQEGWQASLGALQEPWALLTLTRPRQPAVSHKGY